MACSPFSALKARNVPFVCCETQTTNVFLSSLIFNLTSKQLHGDTMTGLNRCWSQHEHFGKIILVHFFSSLDPFFLFSSSLFLCLHSPPVLILCLSPLLLKSNSRMSSRILCLPNLISKQHLLLLFQKGKFLQNLFSWVIFACCSIPSTAMLSTRRRQNWPPNLHCQIGSANIRKYQY